MAMPTLLDIAIRNGSDAVVGLIDETTKAHPEISGMTAVPGGGMYQIPGVGGSRTISGINYKTLIRTAIDASPFRDANEGTAVVKSTWENRLVETFILNPQFEVDKAVADRSEDGWEAFLADEAMGIMEAAMQGLAKQFYYGRSATVNVGNAKAFPGLLEMYDATNMVVDATGTTDDTASSVWAVKFGPRDVTWVWGVNGNLAMSDVTVERILDASSNPFSAYRQELLAYPGLQVGSVRSVARIKKLTADSGKGLTDDLIAQMLGKFEVGVVPDVMFMSRRSLQQLQQSRTATNATGVPAPFPTSAFGVPIAVTDAILNTEKLAW
jgi:hypothetical protein